MKKEQQEILNFVANTFGKPAKNTKKINKKHKVNTELRLKIKTP